MRYVKAGRFEIPDGDWTELTGAFGTLEQAEAFIDNPPRELGDPGTVTLERARDGYRIFKLEDRRAAQERQQAAA